MSKEESFFYQNYTCKWGQCFIGNAKKAGIAPTTFDSRRYFSCFMSRKCKRKLKAYFSVHQDWCWLFFHAIQYCPFFTPYRLFFLVHMDCLLVSSPGLPFIRFNWKCVLVSPTWLPLISPPGLPLIFQLEMPFIQSSWTRFNILTGNAFYSVQLDCLLSSPPGLALIF